MARFRRRFVSERKAAFEIQQDVFLRCLPKKILALMMILLGGGCSKSDLEDCVDAQMKLNEHNLKSNSGVKWESDQEARYSYKAACANALGVHGMEKLEES
jgi:hypothetical protein|tara:strand:+ start:323 stop:625 length:303 start_codon:yes stop_codon:yes gene_type:complete